MKEEADDANQERFVELHKTLEGSCVGGTVFVSNTHQASFCYFSFVQWRECEHRLGEARKNTCITV
jgi:hypothetical protein